MNCTNCSMICYCCYNSPKELILPGIPYFLSHKRRWCLKNVCNAEKLFDKLSRVTRLTPETIREQLARTETRWWIGRVIRADNNMQSRVRRRTLLQSCQVTILSQSYQHLTITTASGQPPDVWLHHSSSVLCPPLSRMICIVWKWKKDWQVF